MKNQIPENSPYMAVLIDLRAKRDEIDQAISAIEKIIGGGSSVSATYPQGSQASSAEIRSDTFFGMSVAEAAEKMLDMHKKPMKAKEIAEGLISGGIHFTTDTPANTVASVLSRHLNSANCNMVKIGRGSFGLAKWYPNSGRFKQKNGKKDKQNQQVDTFEDDGESSNDELSDLA